MKIYCGETTFQQRNIYLNWLICWEISLRHVDRRGISENGKQFVAEADVCSIWLTITKYLLLLSFPKSIRRY